MIEVFLFTAEVALQSVRRSRSVRLITVMLA